MLRSQNRLSFHFTKCLPAGFCGIALATLVVSTATEVHAQTTQAQISGGVLFDCFPGGGDWAKKDCESSGIAAGPDNQVLVVNERIAKAKKKAKTVPKGAPFSNVFGFKLIGNGISGAPSRYIDAKYKDGKDATESKKFEAITFTPDFKHVIASTAFDRVDNAYSRLLVWRWDPANNNPKLSLVGGFIQKTSPVNIHAKMETLIGKRAQKFKCKDYKKKIDPRRIKIEGIATVQDGQNQYLYFGIREIGCLYQQGTPLTVIALVRVKYQFQQGELVLGEKFNLVFYQEGKKAARAAGLPEGSQLGLSDIAYDPSKERFYILTSYEEDGCAKIDECRGFLWTLNGNHRRFRIVKDKASEEPLQFKWHKPEGVTVLSPNKLLVVFDDDDQREAKRPANSSDPIFKGPIESSQSIATVVEVTN